jgi:hypothetical protein
MPFYLYLPNFSLYLEILFRIIVNLKSIYSFLYGPIPSLQHFKEYIHTFMSTHHASENSLNTYNAPFSPANQHSTYHIPV